MNKSTVAINTQDPELIAKLAAQFPKGTVVKHGDRIGAVTGIRSATGIWVDWWYPVVTHGSVVAAKVALIKRG